MVLLSTKNKCLNWCIVKYLQFYTQNLCLSWPVCFSLQELSKENLVTQTDTESVKDIGLVKAISKSQEQKSKVLTNVVLNTYTKSIQTCFMY